MNDLPVALISDTFGVFFGQ